MGPSRGHPLLLLVVAVREHCDEDVDGTGQENEDATCFGQLDPLEPDPLTDMIKHLKVHSMLDSSKTAISDSQKRGIIECIHPRLY